MIEKKERLPCVLECRDNGSTDAFVTRPLTESTKANPEPDFYSQQRGYSVSYALCSTNDIIRRKALSHQYTTISICCGKFRRVFEERRESSYQATQTNQAFVSSLGC